jgi:excisionase family DNA binding protein
VSTTPSTFRLDPERPYTIRELQSLTGISRSHLYRAIHDGSLIAYDLGTYRVYGRDYLTWFASTKVQPRPKSPASPSALTPTPSPTTAVPFTTTAAMEGKKPTLKYLRHSRPHHG